MRCLHFSFARRSRAASHVIFTIAATVLTDAPPQ
jgi:hypothetical protein